MGECHSATATHIVVEGGIASILFTVTGATPLCGTVRNGAVQSWHRGGEDTCLCYFKSNAILKDKREGEQAMSMSVSSAE